MGKVIIEKWTYRHVDEDESKTILGKPNVLFTEGNYNLFQVVIGTTKV